MNKTLRALFIVSSLATIFIVIRKQQTLNKVDAVLTPFQTGIGFFKDTINDIRGTGEAIPLPPACGNAQTCNDVEIRKYIEEKRAEGFSDDSIRKALGVTK